MSTSAEAINVLVGLATKGEVLTVDVSVHQNDTRISSREIFIAS